MCVIAVADKRRPSDEELEKMAKANGDGGAIAYRAKSKPSLDKPDIVKWEKGLTVEQVKALAKEVPLPFVVHFRIASIGPRIPELTHPFPVEREMRRSLAGSINGFVLFHNGTWGSYREKGIDAATRNKVKVPEGPWSDTRVMAWMTHLHGPGILELIDEKVILFGINKIEIFHIEGWFRVNDLLVSNRIWEREFVRHTKTDDDDDYNNYEWMHQPIPRVCRAGNCKETAIGTTWYCADHQAPCRQNSCNKPRALGTEFCREHQPFCQMNGCVQQQEPNDKFCLKHLTVNPIQQPGVSLSHKPEPGGDQKVVPFRPGPTMVQGGKDQQDGVQAPEGSVGEVGPKSSGASTVANDLVTTEKEKWSRPITMNDRIDEIMRGHRSGPTVM